MQDEEQQDCSGRQNDEVEPAAPLLVSSERFFSVFQDELSALTSAFLASCSACREVWALCGGGLGAGAGGAAGADAQANLDLQLEARCV